MKGFGGFSARDRRAVLLGAGVLAAGLALRFGALPYGRFVQDLRTRVAVERDLLSRERALVGDARAVPRQLGSLQDRLTGATPRLFQAPDEMESAAALSAYVVEAAERAGVLLQRTEGRGSREEGEGVVAHQVLVQAVGDLEGALRFLHGLEGGAKLVRVERLTIQPAALQSADAGQARALELAALVSGFRMTPPPDPPSSPEVLP